MNQGDSQHGLQIYSSADNFVVFTGYFVRPAYHTPLKLEKKDYIIPLPKPKIND